jgi:hypothetical protein
MMSGFFKDGSKQKTIAAGILAACAVAIMIYSALNTGKRPKGNIWFYDLKTRQLFAASDSSVPPIDTKSGPEMGVRAYVYTCSGGSNPNDKFIAFIEKFTPEVKKGVEEDLKHGGGQMTIGLALERRPGGVLISQPDAGNWFPKFSDEGRQIMEMGKKKGGCPNPTLCLP